MDLDVSLRTDRVLMSASGYAVPISRLRDEVVLANDVAGDLVRRAFSLSDFIATEKKAMLDEVDAYLALIFERYKAKLGGKRGGLEIATYDGTQKVCVSVADYQRVTAALPAAQSLINEILDDLTDGVDGDLRAMVGNAFKRDAGGRINVERVLELRRLKLSHPKWPHAVEAINDAVETAGSKSYIRFYQRPNSEAQWEQINLNFSSL